MSKESTLGEETVNIVEMTTKSLECYINLVHKEAAGFQRIYPDFDTNSTMDKLLSKNGTHYKEICKKKGQPVQQNLLFKEILILRSYHWTLWHTALGG